MYPFYKFFIFRRSIRSEIGTNIKYDICLLLTLLPYKLNIAVNYVFFFNKSSIWQCNSLGVKFSETLKKIKIEGRTNYNSDTALFNILILSPQKLFNAARAKQTSLQFSTSATDFLPKNNKVQVKLEIVHQGCFFTFVAVITGR